MTNDIAGRLKRHSERMCRLIWEDLSTGHYVLTDPNMDGFEYDIQFSRCNTPEKLVSWIHHLLEKNWVTKDHISRLIYLASERNGFKKQGV